MCGRFTLRTPATVLITQFDLEVSAERQLELFDARYNIAPTQDVAAVRRQAAGGPRQLAFLQWGLIPSWAKDPKIASSCINGRCESIASKPAFRSAIRRRRCLVLADGFSCRTQLAQLAHRRAITLAELLADHRLVRI